MELVAQQMSYEIISASPIANRINISNISAMQFLLGQQIEHSLELFSFFVAQNFNCTENIHGLYEGSTDFTIRKLLDINGHIRQLTLSIETTPGLASSVAATLNAPINLFASISLLLIIMYTWVIAWETMAGNHSSSKQATARTQSVRQLMYTWIFVGLDKVESTEEIIVLSIL
jgi:hypothetical protein